MLKLIKTTDLIKLNALALEVGISYQTLRAEAKKGKLQTFRIGEKVIYTTYQNFEAYLNRNELVNMPLVKQESKLNLDTIKNNAVRRLKQTAPKTLKKGN